MLIGEAGPLMYRWAWEVSIYTPQSTFQADALTWSSKELQKSGGKGLPAPMNSRDSLDGPVVKTSSSNVRGCGFNPWLGSQDPTHLLAKQAKT